MATLSFADKSIAMANTMQEDLAGREFAAMQIMGTHSATPNTNKPSALAIVPSWPHSTQTAVTPIPAMSKTSRDTFRSSIVPEVNSVASHPTSIAKDIITRNNITNTTLTNTMHNPPDYDLPTVLKADAQHLTTDNKFLHDLAEEGLTWADDPDLPPIPFIESEPKKVVIEHPVQERPKGLASSRWAAEPNVAKENKPERPKGLMDSRWASNTQSVAEQQMLGHKFKRELSHYGVKGVGPANGASKPPRPAPQPAYQRSHRPVTQYTPQSNRQIPSPPHSHPGHKSNQGRRWNRNRDSYNGNKSPRHHENKVETTYNGPRLIMDMDEFKQEVEKYGLKTLKDSRWANTEEPKKDAPPKEKVPESIKDMEKPQRDVKSHGLKTLKDSRWANTEEPKKNTRHYKNKVETSYNGPRLIMDMEEFQHDVKKYGLKTLKDSRWAS